MHSRLLVILFLSHKMSSSSLIMHWILSPQTKLSERKYLSKGLPSWATATVALACCWDELSNWKKKKTKGGSIIEIKTLCRNSPRVLLISLAEGLERCRLQARDHMTVTWLGDDVKLTGISCLSMRLRRPLWASSSEIVGGVDWRERERECSES